MKNHGSSLSWRRRTDASRRLAALAIVVAVALVACAEIDSMPGAEDEPLQPTVPEIDSPALEPPECSRPGPMAKVCRHIHLLGTDLLEFPGSPERLVRSRIVVTPERRVRYEVKVRRMGNSLNIALDDYDGKFERFGWLLDPGSPSAFPAERKQVTRHYVGVASVPPPGTDSVPNKGYEATLHLTEVPVTGAPPDVIVEGVIQTIDPVPAGPK